MQRPKKLYCGTFGPVVLAPAAAGSTAFDLINNSRNNLLKSVTWSFLIYDDITNEILTDDNNNVIDISLGIYQLNTAENVGFDFISVTPPAPTNSQAIIIIHEGQYFWNDIFFSNGIRFDVAYGNVSAARSYDITWHIAVEIEERSYFDKF